MTSRLYRPLGLGNADWARLKKQAAARRNLSASTVPTHDLEVWEGEGGYVPVESPLEPSRALPDYHQGFHFIGGRR